VTAFVEITKRAKPLSRDDAVKTCAPDENAEKLSGGIAYRAPPGATV